MICFMRRSILNTVGLLGAVPKLQVAGDAPTAKLTEIPGLVPSLVEPIEGCVFADRCPRVTGLCRQVSPVLEEKAAAHWAACHHVTMERAGA